MKHLNCTTQITPQLHQAIESVQLWTGIQHWLFAYKTHPCCTLTLPCWLTTIWENVSHHNLIIMGPYTSLHPQCHHDTFIIEDMVRHRAPLEDLYHINICRMHLQAVTLADITTAIGTHITQGACYGIMDPRRRSSLQWPSVPRPPQHMWRTWQRYLDSHYVYTPTTRLLQELGPWTATPHQQW